MSSKVTVPPAMNENSCTASPAFAAVTCLDFGHSNRYVMVSHGCCFNLYFIDDTSCRASFLMLFLCLYALCISSLVRCLLRSLAQFSIRLPVFLLLGFKAISYLVDRYQIYLLWKFSTHLWFVRRQFPWYCFLKCRCFHLLIISFINYVFGAISKNTSTSGFSPIVLHFTCRPITHIRVHFCEGCKECSSTICWRY